MTREERENIKGILKQADSCGWDEARMSIGVVKMLISGLDALDAAEERAEQLERVIKCLEKMPDVCQLCIHNDTDFEGCDLCLDFISPRFQFDSEWESKP